MTEFPAVPADRLDDGGWERIEGTTDTLARLPIVTVEGHTLVYEDRRLRERVADAVGVDRPWRFFFATRLTFSPPPPPGVGPTAFGSIVRSRAKDGFVERLRDRGFESVERASTARVRVRTGERAELTGYDAESTVSGDDETRRYPVEGWVAVWHHDGAFRIAGGGYPATDLGDVLNGGPETDPGKYRDELFELLRDVG